jgi:hypothetical protein
MASLWTGGYGGTTVLAIHSSKIAANKGLCILAQKLGRTHVANSLNLQKPKSKYYTAHKH